ncbi:MAG: neutral zinc metallopeptidase [Actinomycetota bacterium]
MKLGRLRRRSGGVIDQRGQGTGMGSLGGFGSGGGSGFPIGGGMGIGGIIIVLLLIFIVPKLLGSGGGSLPGDATAPFSQAGTVPAGGSSVDPTDPTGQFVDAVTDDVQTTWDDIFQRTGKTYEDTSVVLFTGATSTGCGQATSDVGPFYCPADRMVYLDTGFFKELETRFGAPGDFAEAYVIAHEIGHHVQTLLGIDDQVQQMVRDDPSRRNDLSIRQELQADCFAGVWGRAAQGAGVLEAGDLEEGLKAAAAVGDDRIQKAATGRINPETWTHGSSEQRVQWFRNGFNAGNPDACDTFSGTV